MIPVVKAQESQLNPIAWMARQEFERRKEKNPAYSLRAFASSLGVPPSTLSALLSGRRNAGNRLERQIRASLDGKRLAIPKPSRFLKISLDEFQLISDWHHSAFMELLSLKDFRSDFSWAAARLGVRVNEAKSILNRLQQAGLIRIEGGQWRDTTGGYSTTLDPKATSAAAKTHQKQLLECSRQSIEQDPYDRRNHTNATFAVRLDRLDQAKELIAEFRRSFSRLLASTKDGDEVYTLQISFFPMTNGSQTHVSGGKE